MTSSFGIDAMATCEESEMLASLGYEVTYTYSQEPRTARVAECSSILSEIKEVIDEKFAGGLYCHQAKAITQAVNGNNVVISTGTASGKTIAFAIPVFQQLMNDPNARALFFYPTKALAGDQWEKLHELAGRFGFFGTVFKFDGDTPEKTRKAALKNGRILLCTPDVLHRTMLRRNMEADYKDLFSNLKYIVLDESHIYSGAFGSNMAYLLRRLRQVCRRVGSTPQIMAASATSKDPAGHMKKLTGQEFVVITEEENGSPSGGRDFFVAVQKDIEETSSVIDIVAKFIKLDRKFIVFCHSRRITEQLFIDLVEKYPNLEGQVMPYRSGYEYEDRLMIENALRSGELTGVISTSALELGVDLPDLEYCVLVGIPSTAMSFWQRVGRVGRSPNSRGKVIIIPSKNSIDEYYRHHPESLFSRELEELVLHLDNWQLILAHFACARMESGNFEQPDLDTEIFGNDFAKLSDNIHDMDIEDEVLITTEPHQIVGIRGIDDSTFEIYTSGGEQRLGTISYSQVLREAYPQAVYRHMGEAFRVERVKNKDKTIRVKKETRSVSTSPTGFVVVKERVNNGIIYRRAIWGNALEMWHTTVAVNTITSGYRERVNGQWVNQEKYPMPLQRRVVSEGVWFKFGPQFGRISKEALNAFAHALSNIFSIFHPCDPAEISTHSVVNSKDGKSYCYIFDTTSGGLGITAAVFDHFAKLLEPVRERLTKCDYCDSDADSYDKGCPACIQVPRWYEDNEHLSKRKALELLNKISDVLRESNPQLYISEAYKKRNEGALTAIEAVQAQNSGEIAEEEMAYGISTFSIDSFVQLRSGQRGRVTGSRLENNQLIYDLKMDDGREAKVKNLGNNLTLLEGKQSVMCLNCGQDEIDREEYICPMCSVLLKSL